MEPEEYPRLFAVERDHWRFRALRSVLRAALARFAPRGAPLRILDAGCGCGGTAAELAREARVVGLDAHAAALGFARQAGVAELVRGDVQALPFAPARFDAVVSVDVLYHRAVSDDARALAELARVCRPGGVVVLWLPAYDWLRSAHDSVVHTARRYTRRRLLALARGAQLTPLRVSYVGALLFPAAAAHRLLTRGASEPRSDLAEAPRGLAARALEAWIAAEGRLALRTTLPFGLSLLAVLRKPE
jgi:SAM-dependent methyltransferase